MPCIAAGIERRPLWRRFVNALVALLVTAITEGFHLGDRRRARGRWSLRLPDVVGQCRSAIRPSEDACGTVIEHRARDGVHPLDSISENEREQTREAAEVHSIRFLVVRDDDDPRTCISSRFVIGFHPSTTSTATVGACPDSRSATILRP